SESPRSRGAWSRASSDVLLSAAAFAGCAVLAASQRALVSASGSRAAARDRAKVLARIRDVLAASRLRIVFQPIVSTDTGRMVGAEALSRFDAFNPADLPDPPDVVFADAATVGLGVELELLALRTAL